MIHTVEIMNFKGICLCVILRFLANVECNSGRNNNKPRKDLPTETNLTLPPNCFSQCLNYTHHSGQIGFTTSTNRTCVNWGHNGAYINESKLIGNMTFCKYGKGPAWCQTENYTMDKKSYDWDYCQYESCRSVKTDDACSDRMKLDITSYSIKFQLGYLSTNNDTIIVLYNDTNQCFIVGLNNRRSLKINYFRSSFFPFCTQIESKFADYTMVTLHSLPESTNYRMYIIPILTNTTIGTVTRMNVTTKQKVTLTSNHITVVNVNSNSIRIKYPSLYDLNLEKDDYNITLLYMETQTKRPILIPNESVVSLDPCREYILLLKVIKLNNTDIVQSVNKTFCIKTVINNLKGKEKNITWSLANKYNCPITFGGSYYSLTSNNNTIFHFKTDKNWINIPELEYGDSYHVKVITYLPNRTQCPIYENHSDWTEFKCRSAIINTNSALILYSTVLVSLGILVVLLLLLKRKSIWNRWNKNSMSSVPFEEKTLRKKIIISQPTNSLIPESSQAILITKIYIGNFVNHYTTLCQKHSELIRDEYKDLSKRTNLYIDKENVSSKIGLLSHNMKKNRFSNILPYDHNRVVLNDRSFEDSYINASYIPFENDANKVQYIASQGPINSNVSDFWKMIWDEEINCIIMLTECYENEKFKCVKYWPDVVKNQQAFGKDCHIQVQLLEEETTPNYIERTLELNIKNTYFKRSITQLHMTSWSDFSTPNLQTFERLLFRFHELSNQKVKTPYLIHCSAGVGRTGTFITIDRIIKKVIDGVQYLDIYNEVLELRKYRNFMVQRMPQYCFIYEFIGHFLDKYLQFGQLKEINLYHNE